MNPIIRSIKTASSLGIRSSIFYAIYQLGIKTGHYRRVTPIGLFVSIPEITDQDIQWQSVLPDKKELFRVIGKNAGDLKFEADEILNNRLRFFGGPAIPFRFEKEDESCFHWTDAESIHNKKGSRDIKLTWEPARFQWVFTLARAYLVFGQEKYADKFWDLFNEFTFANPFNSGLNWTSGQEVALRLMALLFGGAVFKSSKNATPPNLALLLSSIYLHAQRIPPTLMYARAQNNNHLIVEAVALYCAGSFFKTIPIAQTWKELGWKQFNRAIQEQIAENGEYNQHSLNYHRLMLQAALWMNKNVLENNTSLPGHSLKKIQLATKFLLNYVNPTNGKVPNLGHNDGSNIFPLSQCDYPDYRPVAQAASIAFLEKSIFSIGCWDEESIWLNLKYKNINNEKGVLSHQNDVLWIGDSNLRLYLQALHYHSRPAHADQLHADIWYKGFNLALDAGTYSYNLPAPWQNALAETLVHNTIIIDDQNQMTKAGKFLWLDWANAEIKEFDPGKNRVTASQDGYRKMGIMHERKIKLDLVANRIVIEDSFEMNRSRNGNHTVCLNWLLPDWPWKMDQNGLTLQAPFGEVRISLSNSANLTPNVDLVKAGKSLLLKRTENPILGWYSATYLNKMPALSLLYKVPLLNELCITTNWHIEDNQS